jgi:hypothetical protein
MSIYKNAFEWRFEFPEVLSNNGNLKALMLLLEILPMSLQEKISLPQ